MDQPATLSESTSSHHRRLLVLSGGGAKGAYAFGVLKALNERFGLRFDAVIGTSVGALNAFLWSANALERGEAIYRSLSFDTVYPFRIPLGRFLSDKFKLRIGACYVLFRVIFAVLTGRPIIPDAEGPVKKVLHIVFTIPYVILLLSAPSGVPTIAFCLLFVVWINGVCYLAFTEREVLVLPTLWLFGVGPWIAIAVASMLWLVDQPGKADFIEGAGILAVLFVFAVFAYLASDRFSVLSSSGLADQVQSIVNEGYKASITTYVVGAQKCEVRDPKNGYAYVPLVGISDQHRATMEWVPRYWQIDEAPSGEILQYLLATAALPFGVVPPVRVKSMVFVDGGVADNVPMREGIALSGADEVFVVLLEKFESDEQAVSIRALSYEHFMSNRRLVEYGHPKSWAWVPPGSQQKNDVQVIPFYPSEELGGFWDGTLAFNSKYALEKIELGYRDTVKRLSGTKYDPAAAGSLPRS